MSVDTNTSLAEIVNRSPGSARVLESFGLDYCCGGARSLSEASEAAGVDPAAVVDALGDISGHPAPEWTSMGMAELVDHIESTHHAYLHAELPRLDALAEKVASVHGANHPELIELRADVRDLYNDLEPHLKKEEMVLFPMLRQLADPNGTPPPMPPAQPIAVMMAEHDVAGELLERIRARTNGFAVPADGCASYQQLYLGLAEVEADTHLHVHKENNVLFPMALGQPVSTA